MSRLATENIRGQEEQVKQADLASILADPEEMMVLQRFLGGSVTTKTLKGYEREWRT